MWSKELTICRKLCLWWHRTSSWTSWCADWSSSCRESLISAFLFTEPRIFISRYKVQWKVWISLVTFTFPTSSISGQLQEWKNEVCHWIDDLIHSVFSSALSTCSPWFKKQVYCVQRCHSPGAIHPSHNFVATFLVTLCCPRSHRACCLFAGSFCGFRLYLCPIHYAYELGLYGCSISMCVRPSSFLSPIHMRSETYCWRIKAHSDENGQNEVILDRTYESICRSFATTQNKDSINTSCDLMVRHDYWCIPQRLRISQNLTASTRGKRNGSSLALLRLRDCLVRCHPTFTSQRSPLLWRYSINRRSSSIWQSVLLLAIALYTSEESHWFYCNRSPCTL